MLLLRLFFALLMVNRSYYEVLHTLVTNLFVEIIRLFQQCFIQGSADTLPVKATRTKPDISEIRQLLSRPEYEDTWLFDVSDLSNLGISVSQESDSEGDWVRQCAAQIGGSELADRVLAMAEHMAKWHSWKGEEDASALLATLADDVAERNKDSLLLHVMVERLADWIHTE
jgi:hypothetical protein